MIKSLNTATTGLQQFQQKLNIISQNVANVQTTGYKSERTAFADALASSDPSQAGAGSGVATSSVVARFSQGSITATGVHTDLAISGQGFFMVRNTQDGQLYATRAGDFTIDSSGFLTTQDGKRVQGFSDAGLSTAGDVQIDKTGMPATFDPNAEITGFGFDSAGRLHVQLNDGNSFVRGQVLLQNFQNPQALLKVGQNLFSGAAAAGPVTGDPATLIAPGLEGAGFIAAESLELSNVDLATEFSDLITTQRSFQASARMISTSDEIIQELVNLKR